MKPIIRKILAVIIGLLVGGLVNMGIVLISSHIIPPPNGVDVTTMESLKANLHLFKPINFLMPWLAHGLGSMVGAFIAYLIAVDNKMKFALAIGIFFLVGGIMNIYMLPSPTWFTIVDLGLAYIPMAWLGGKIASKI